MTAIGRVRVQHDGDVVVAGIAGELDLSNTSEVRSTIVSSITNDTMGLVVDLSATSYFDSTGLSMLFDLARRLSRRQQALRVVVPAGSPLRRLLDIAGFPSVASLDESLDDAVVAITELSDDGPEEDADGFGGRREGGI